MKFKALIIPALALAAGTFLIPSDSEGFTLLGHNLSLSQRDFRVFNNFTDTAANNNQVPDSQYPGYQGATMALWKGAVEWGSRLHGNGSGDPQQPNGLGSGGANFDPSFQGNATGVGNINQNVMSELGGNGGGVLAFAEGNFAFGWRIRFYQNWVWSDGPGNVPSQEDLQGIGCHEFGHVVGMGHTTTSGATMGAFASGNGYTDRSIATDDINGVRAIYGVASVTKPVISGHNLCGNTLEIMGSNFSASNNEVWFTQVGVGGAGTPVKVFSVTSSGGLITVLVPANAGSGDILVKNSGNGHANLSNAWPFDVSLEGNCVDPIESFCNGDGGNQAGCTNCPCGNNAPIGGTGGCLNGTGASCALIGSGNTQISDDTLEFNIVGGNPNTFAVLLSGSDQLPNNVVNPCLAGSGVQAMQYDGLRCIGANVLRHGTRAMNAFGSNLDPWGGSGAPVFGFAVQGGFAAGQTRHWQVVYREDPNLSCGRGLNTSNGLSQTWTP